MRVSSHSDVLPIAHNMRAADVDEIWASHNVTPFEGLQKGLETSKICLTATHKGVPVAMFGVNDIPDFSGEGIVWFLGTPVVDNHRLSFGVMSKKIVEYFLSEYKAIHNWVDVRNIKSIEWLKWLGAEFQDPAPYGSMGMMFQFFRIRRPEYV